MIIMLINATCALLTLAGIVLCTILCLFQKKSLLRELQAIRESFEDPPESNSARRFTFFLAARKVDFWIIIVEKFATTSLIASLLVGIVNWGQVIDSAAVEDEIREFLQNPGLLFYGQFAVLMLACTYLVLICHAMHEYTESNGVNAGS
jgi:uncharacterized membrane protein YdbT with pleckstrin-like domain